MAKYKTVPAENVPEPLEVLTKTADAVITYTKEEFAKAAKTVFGVPAECVQAAFSVAGVEKAAEAEAKQIVGKFMNREVK